MAKYIDTITEVVKQAFFESHEGYSTDEVIICDRLNKEFIKVCKKRLSSIGEEKFNFHLIKLRKQGKLGKVAKRRVNSNHEDYIHASEIAARLIYDKYGHTVDRVFCKPGLKKEFDSIAQSIAPDVSTYLLRKAAFKLRKNRQLRPELVPKVATWSRSILNLKAEEIIHDNTLVPRNPGVYIFWDSSGYLYIGESKDLFLRIKKHLDHSDRKSLAHYFWENGFGEITVELHVFDINSNARLKSCRQAYESNLIEIRRPQFNLRP
jgi:predicted GIY-YIG superfamily endonuclease